MNQANWYRLIPSCFPTINVFEEYYTSSTEFEIAFYIEGLTNDRLQCEAGNLMLVDRDDWIYGAGTTPILAAFTHTGNPSRFTDGSYGVFYAGDSINVSISETMHHMRKKLMATNEESGEFCMRAYMTHTKKTLKPLFSKSYRHLFTEEYNEPQRFADKERKKGVFGFHYQSVRYQSGNCIAVFRPPALAPVTQGSHYRYIWDGDRQKFTKYFQAEI